MVCGKYDIRNSREAEPEDDSKTGFSVNPSSLKNKQGISMSNVLPANQVCSILRGMYAFLLVGGNKTAPNYLTVPSSLFPKLYFILHIQKQISICKNNHWSFFR